MAKDLIIRGNSIYSIADGPSWEDAESNANKLGGHLVTISDEEENNFIQNKFTGNEYLNSNILLIVNTSLPTK